MPTAHQLFKNNADSTVNGTIAIGASFFNVAPGHGTRFPTPSAGQYFLATLFEKNVGGGEINFEIVKVTSVTGDTLTVVRDFEGIVVGNGGTSGGWAYPSAVGINPSQITYVQLRLTAYGAGNSLAKDGNLEGLESAATARSNLGISAANTPNTPAGNIAATTVQAAINELDTEKVSKSGDTMTGPLALSAGSASLPSLTTAGDVNTGVLFPDADTVAVATGGAERLRIGADGNVSISKSLHIPGGGGLATNEAFGTGALGANTTGIQNTASGVNALLNNTTGNNNTASGVNALQNNTTGGQNTASGVSALQNNTTGGQNTASGVSALQNNTTGAQNTASGVGALLSNTTGNSNTASGVYALLSNTTGYNNTASGVQVLYFNTTGNSNTASGYSALQANTTGSYNTASGVSALYANTTYSNCSGLGYNAQITGDNQVQLGDGATTTYVYGTVQNRSDLRDKADVRDTQLGLDFVMSLRPVDYKWDMREDYRPDAPAQPTLQKPTDEDADDYQEQLDAYEAEQSEHKAAMDDWLIAVKPENIVRDGSKKRTRYHHGFIAQEVMALDAGFGGVQDHSKKGGEDVLSIGYDELIAPLVKAMQELKAEFDAYKVAHP